MLHTCDLRIADVRIRFLTPQKIRFEENFHPFLVPTDGVPDITVDVQLGAPPVELSAGQLHRVLIEADGTGVVRFEPDDPAQPVRLYVSPTMAEKVFSRGNWLSFLPLERLLLPFGCVILHASAVVYRGKAYVFTAPSGVGKSTQADIWHREFGAEIINGDKVILSVRDGMIAAHGSPVAGSSGIYKQCSAPVAAIIQLKQSARNDIVPANNRSGYFAIYSGLVKSTDDAQFNCRLLDHVETIMHAVPVLTLFCRPERQAAECVQTWMGIL